MSRVRFQTQQEVRASPSPVQWYEQSEDSSDGDLDNADGVERSPSPAEESQEYDAEYQEAYVDYEHHRSGDRNQYHKASRSRLLNRRPSDTEDQEVHVDNELRRSERGKQHHEASRSPMLNRRPIKQGAAVAKDYRSRRESSESYHPEASVSKFQFDRQPKHDNRYRPQFHEVKAKKPLVEVNLILIVLPIIAFLILIAILFGEKSHTSEEISHTRTEDMTAAVKNALSQYENISPNVVFQLSAGIRSIVESDPNKPSIFVFLHNNTGDGPFCLANAIGSVAMKYLESDEKAPLILSPNELLQNEKISEDYGWIIENYRPYIEKHRSVIVTDLQKFPGRMAMAFHFLCDTYSPVVPKSLFLFTLHVPDVHSKKGVEQAENAMHKIWRDEVSDDQRQALITRLTEDIIPLPTNILHNAACP